MIPEITEAGEEFQLEDIRVDDGEKLDLVMANLALEGDTEMECEEETERLMMISKENEVEEVTVSNMVQNQRSSLSQHILLAEGNKVNNTEDQATSSQADLEEAYKQAYERLKVQLNIVGELLDTSIAIDEPDPKSWKQAMSCANKRFWLKAALDEILSITKMRTFRLTRQIPPGRKALPAK
ncbi:hypothetical protein BGX38DRAFT_1270350 [Terfezia claveryi]|nr:hypothetical protein BGX38DRAFT_1270350 [Terfezia claveryi]